MLQTEKKHQRHLRILSKLLILQYATRKQLQAVENMGKVRNAQRILQDMEREKLISSMKKEQKIYFLANRGKELLGITGKELTGRMVEHSLMRNDLYIRLQMPSDWAIEIESKTGDGEVFVSDAVYTKNGEIYFVEVDYKQAMQRNIEKIDRYAKVKMETWQVYKQHVRLIFYTTTIHRKQRLEEYMRKKGLNGKVYKK